ncbi:MAG: MlaD family protein [Treponema sp.]|jgi:phospholipid/cholesterol/gamma-HCH transport system substrate-binding protein|nr:MlaD family protein [Treponema sp.]
MKVSRYVKIALFFIVMGTAGGAYIILSGDGLSDFNTKVYEVVLTDATGLSTRSKIYLAGVAVGKIKEIHLEGNEARLKVAFLKNVEIRSNATISRKSSSILGTSVLSLEPGSAVSPLVPPGSRIGSQPEGGDLSAIMGTVQELGGQLSELLKSFQENQLALLSVSLETINSIAGKINYESDAELERVSRILESTAVITERLEQLMADSGVSGIERPGDLYGALENIRFITEEVRQGQGNLGRIVYDEQLYAALLSAVQRIDDASAKIQTALDSIDGLVRNADGVVTDAGVIVKKAVGLGVEFDAFGRYDVISDQMRAGASLRLAPGSNDRWYRVGVTSAPNGVASRTVKETTEDGPINVKYTTETKNSFSVDAELARRFGMLTLHGGLLESTAGLGVDLQPWKWVSLSGEVFDFQKDRAPNLRGTVTVYPFFDPNSDKPWNWLYLKGGIDNALVDDKRDYFFGGGLRFTDSEIKGLVGLIPALNN